jgi:hypothetical protein
MKDLFENYEQLFEETKKKKDKPGIVTDKGPLTKQQFKSMKVGGIAAGAGATAGALLGHKVGDSVGLRKLDKPARKILRKHRALGLGIGAAAGVGAGAYQMNRIKKSLPSEKDKKKKDLKESQLFEAQLYEEKYLQNLNEWGKTKAQKEKQKRTPISNKKIVANTLINGAGGGALAGHGIAGITGALKLRGNESEVAKKWLRKRKLKGALIGAGVGTAVRGAVEVAANSTRKKNAAAYKAKKAKEKKANK